MWNRCFLAAWFLVTWNVITVEVYAQQSFIDIPRDFQLRVEKEELSGLEGELTIRGKNLTLPLALETQRFRSRGYALHKNSQKRKLAADEAIVYVSGNYFNVFNRGSEAAKTAIFSHEEYRAHFVDMQYFLSYPLAGEPGTLVLTTAFGDNTVWKMSNFVEKEKTIRRVRSGGHYVAETTIEYQLEATNRPGWFLTVDDKKRMTLSKDKPPRHTIKYFLRAYYDNLNDGK